MEIPQMIFAGVVGFLTVWVLGLTDRLSKAEKRINELRSDLLKATLTLNESDSVTRKAMDLSVKVLAERLDFHDEARKGHNSRYGYLKSVGSIDEEKNDE